MNSEHQNHHMRSGMALAIGTYAFWGCFPIFFKAVQAVPPLELLAHRIVWSFVFTLLLVSVLGLWPAVIKACASKKRMLYFISSAILIAANWLLFVFGVVNDQILELSLGYFLNPVFNIIFGVLFFRERLNRPTQIAIAFVTVGLMIRATDLSQFPLLALTIALVFSLYGVVRKLAPTDSTSGLFIETTILLPFALVFLLAFPDVVSVAMMSQSVYWSGMLILAGPLTSLPLIGFAMAVKRIPYYMVGFCQYLTPTIFMFMAVFLFDEPVKQLDIVTFGCVWAGITLMLVNSMLSLKKP